MPFALITAGLIMIVVSAKGTHLAFGQQLRSDFTGDANFLYWLGSIGAVGAAGYINPFREFSHLFMALIIISMVIKNADPKTNKNGGFFAQFQDAIKNGPISPSKSGVGSQPNAAPWATQTPAQKSADAWGGPATASVAGSQDTQAKFNRYMNYFFGQ